MPCDVSRWSITAHPTRCGNASHCPWTGVREMGIVRKTIRGLVRQTGFDIVRYQGKRLGVDPYKDMQRFLKGVNEPVIFDVGANVGQSVDDFKATFPGCTIHSFEPSPSTYQMLKAHCEGVSNVQAWNYGVGSVDTTLTLEENEYSDMTSFLRPSTLAWGNIVKSTEVPVVALDSFAKDHDVEFIHILKSDTQGYDFEVMKGADRLMKENRIGLVFFEFIFSDQYTGIPPFDEVYRYLMDHNFTLVTFYRQFYQREVIGWTDALFINREFHKKRLEDYQPTGLRNWE